MVSRDWKSSFFREGFQIFKKKMEGFYRVLLGFTGFYLVVQDFTEFYWVVPSFEAFPFHHHLHRWISISIFRRVPLDGLDWISVASRFSTLLFSIALGLVIRLSLFAANGH